MVCGFNSHQNSDCSISEKVKAFYVADSTEPQASSPEVTNAQNNACYALAELRI